MSHEEMLLELSDILARARGASERIEELHQTIQNVRRVLTGCVKEYNNNRMKLIRQEAITRGLKESEPLSPSVVNDLERELNLPPRLAVQADKLVVHDIVNPSTSI